MSRTQAAAEPQSRDSSTVCLFRDLVRRCVAGALNFDIGPWHVVLGQRSSAGGGIHKSLHVQATQREGDFVKHAYSCTFNEFEHDGELVVSRGFVMDFALRQNCRTQAELIQELLQRATDKTLAQLRAEAAAEPAADDALDTLYEGLLGTKSIRYLDSTTRMSAFSSSAERARVFVYVDRMHPKTETERNLAQYVAARRERGRVHVFLVRYRGTRRTTEPELVGSFRDPGSSAPILPHLFNVVQTDWLKRKQIQVEAHVIDSAFSVLAASPGVAVLAAFPAFLSRSGKAKRPPIQSQARNAAHISGVIAGYNYQFQLQGDSYSGWFSEHGQPLRMPAHISFADNQVKVELLSPEGIGYECSLESVHLIRNSTEYSVRRAIEGAARGLSHYREMPWECNG